MKNTDIIKIFLQKLLYLIANTFISFVLLWMTRLLYPDVVTFRNPYHIHPEARDFVFSVCLVWIVSAGLITLCEMKQHEEQKEKEAPGCVCIPIKKGEFKVFEMCQSWFILDPTDQCYIAGDKVIVPTKDIRWPMQYYKIRPFEYLFRQCRDCAFDKRQILFKSKVHANTTTFDELIQWNESILNNYLEYCFINRIDARRFLPTANHNFPLSVIVTLFRRLQQHNEDRCSKNNNIIGSIKECLRRYEIIDDNMLDTAIQRVLCQEHTQWRSFTHSYYKVNQTYLTKCKKRFLDYYAEYYESTYPSVLNRVIFEYL
jgi:hypothetical protein